MLTNDSVSADAEFHPDISPDYRDEWMEWMEWAGPDRMGVVRRSGRGQTQNTWGFTMGRKLQN